LIINKETDQTKELIISLMLSFATAVGAHFLLDTMPVHYDALVVIGSLFLSCLSLWAYFRQKPRLGRVVHYIIYYFTIVFFILILIYYITRFMILTDKYGLEYMLEQNIENAFFLFMAICFLQPIMLPLPEPVTVLAGSTVLGSRWAFIGSYIGTTLGICTMFAVTKYGGERLWHKKVNSKALAKYDHYVNKYGQWVLGALLIFPVLPDEIICLGAGVSRMPYQKFLPIVIVAKLVTSFSLSYLPELII